MRVRSTTKHHISPFFTANPNEPKFCFGGDTGLSGFTVLPASWRDLGALHHLEHLCFEDDAWPLIDLVVVLTMPGVLRIKAVAEGKMAGFVSGDPRQSDGMGWITTLGVLPEFRRQGIAEALLQACEQGLHLPVLRLCVRQSNHSAIQLYIKHGYHQVDIWKKYYNGQENALVLEKRPTPGKNNRQPADKTTISLPGH
jgi:ribosomal protein S18 acetylase RimI-like enzyme